MNKGKFHKRWCEPVNRQRNLPEETKNKRPSIVTTLWCPFTVRCFHTIFHEWSILLNRLVSCLDRQLKKQNKKLSRN